MPHQAAYRATPTNPTADTAGRPAGGATVEDIDVLLDEIDSVLEENVLEVLQKFVNKGGE